MRTRDHAAMLEAIKLAAIKLQTATDKVLLHKKECGTIDDCLFQNAKDAHNEWCKAVDWYNANLKRSNTTSMIANSLHTSTAGFTDAKTH